MSKKKSAIRVSADTELLGRVKDRIRQSQVRAVLSVNAELLRLYWDIGELLDARQDREGHGAAVIPQLSRDLRDELPEVKGFSEWNIGRMIAFSGAIRTRPEFWVLPGFSWVTNSEHTHKKVSAWRLRGIAMHRGMF